MASYPHIVMTAWNVLNVIFKEWGECPYRWGKERDIQAEIGGRINTIFTLEGIDTITGKYGSTRDGWKEDQTWSRLCYEPTVWYLYEEKRTYCYPDIIIWDNSSDPPDYDNNEQWPIAWACELKYDSSDDGKWDIQKLEHLIDQKIIKYGCCIKIFHRYIDSVKIVWGKYNNKIGKKLWICEISLPIAK